MMDIITNHLNTGWNAHQCEQSFGDHQNSGKPVRENQTIATLHKYIL